MMMRTGGMTGAVKAILGVVVVLAAALAAAADSKPAAATKVAYGERGVLASRSPLASAIGLDVMRRGGTAVDAAVAVGFALAVTYPAAGNLGGGGFMVIRLAGGEVVVNDHRETAPAKARRDIYLDANGEVVPDLSTASHLAVGVPGSVEGLLAVLRRHGTMTRRGVIAPALRLAREGFPLPADIAEQFQRRREQFARYPASLAKFTRPGGGAYKAGDIFRQPDLAATLERIIEQGRAGFYGGRTADLIAAEMKRGGGLVSRGDLGGYRSAWRSPIRGSYRGYEIISMPPPSAGGVLLTQMLNMLEPYDLTAMGATSPNAIHLMVEAERRAYADRAEYLGDPDFYDVPVAMLTDKDYAQRRFADFNPRTASRSEQIGAGKRWPEESPETTHVSILDAAGNAVAYTTTLNHSFGAKMVVAGAGFLLNNEMDDFSSKDNTPNSFGLTGRAANAIEPGKRMLSSMTPTIVQLDGEPFLITGSPGGSTIITTVLQVVTNVIDHGMSLENALATPRVHHQWLPDRVVFEPGALSPGTLAVLENRGHTKLMPIGFPIGDANSVMRLGKQLIGASDPRNAGGAAGY